MIRKCTLISLFCLFYLISNGQDVLVRKNGKTIEGKVTEVGLDRVSYRISSEPNSAIFVVRKNELNRIEFGNGQTVILNDPNFPGKTRSETPANAEGYGRSMISFSPFKAIDSGPGIGLSYEVQVDRRQFIGVVIPVSVTFPERYNYIFDNGGSGRAMYYVSPGLKIYPFSQRRVTYAVGPNVFLGFGKGKTSYTDYNPSTGVYTSRFGTTQNFRMGVLVNNYVNFQITPKFQITLNGGLGSRYVDREKTDLNVVNRGGINITGEFNFSFGLRF